MWPSGRDAALLEEARQPRSIRASPFNASPTQGTEALRPGDQLLVAGEVRRYREGSLYSTDCIDDDADMNVEMRVDAENDL